MRNLSPEMVAEVTAPAVAPALLVELVFDAVTIRLWTGIGNLSYGGEIFSGAGNLIGISSIDETQNTEARGIVASLNGVPSTMVAMALGQNPRGRPFRLFFAVVDSRRYIATEDEPGRVELEDGSGYILLENNLINTPYRIFSGLMDTFEMADNGESANIRLAVENALIVGQRTKVQRYSNEDQKKAYPNDRGLEFINPLQDKELVW